MKTLVENYHDMLVSHLDDVKNYLVSDCTKASVAQKIRVKSVALAKQAAELRKATVAHHKKAD